ncbi:MAG TPA: TadE family protein, partial [Acidimicrobiales bacterium]|nr:TadE family protein [Acidimicrobiales bacterium]
MRSFAKLKDVSSVGGASFGFVERSTSVSDVQPAGPVQGIDVADRGAIELLRRPRASYRKRALMRRVADERGSLAVELSVLAPILIAFMLLVVFAGRVAQVEADVRSAAQEGARAASLRASPASAEAAA